MGLAKFGKAKDPKDHLSAWTPPADPRVEHIYGIREKSGVPVGTFAVGMGRAERRKAAERRRNAARRIAKQQSASR